MKIWGRRVGWAIALACVGTLAACGGGGGGGGGSGDSGPQIRFDRASVALAYNEGQAPAVATLNATASGTISGGLFVGATTPSGQPDPNIDRIDVQINSATLSATVQVIPKSGLAGGAYTGELTLQACADQSCTRHISGSPFRLTYRIVVHPFLRVAAGALVLDSETPATGLRGSATVGTSGTAPATGANWQATSNAPWLRLTRASGRLGEAVEYQLDLPAALALPGYTDHLALIDVTMPGATGDEAVQPTRTTVTVRKELAEVHYAGPAQILPGTPQRVILRGRGFDRLTNPAVRLRIDGVVPTSVSRQSATALELQLPALAAGRYGARVDNALGVTTDSGNLLVVGGGAYPEAKLSLSGSPTAMVIDEARRAVYLASDSENAFRRIRLVGSAWEADAPTALPGLMGLAMGADGESLLVGGTQELRQIDTVSWATVRSFIPPSDLPRYFTRHGLTVTNDGRVWMATGGSSNGTGLFLDLRNGEFGRPLLAPGIGLVNYIGPWFATSRNGEPLLMVQATGLSPEPPLLVLDNVADVFRLNPAGLTYFYEASFSADGDRFVLTGWATVYDRQLGLVGRVADDNQGDAVHRYVMAPDGRHAYGLSLRNGGVGPVSAATVLVFDTSRSSAQLPMIGTFAAPASTVCGSADTYSCREGPMTITADGRTLLWAGPAGFASITIPPNMR